jgi:hypothetical protein
LLATRPRPSNAGEENQQSADNSDSSLHLSAPSLLCLVNSTFSSPLFYAITGEAI